MGQWAAAEYLVAVRVERVDFTYRLMSGWWWNVCVVAAEVYSGVGKVVVVAAAYEEANSDVCKRESCEREGGERDNGRDDGSKTSS